MRAMCVALLGLIQRYGRRLDGREASAPISLRHLLVSAVAALPATPCHVVYVRVTENAPEGACILEYLVFLKDKYRPGEEGRCRYVVLQGDHFTYQFIFKSWRESIRRKDSGGLWEWLIVLSGGFHIEKTGLQGVVRKALSGFGLDELVGFSGLSKGHIDGWETLSIWRKVREFCTKQPHQWSLN